jgi:hypothetical protein
MVRRHDESRSRLLVLLVLLELLELLPFLVPCPQRCFHSQLLFWLEDVLAAWAVTNDSWWWIGKGNRFRFGDGN